MKVSILLLHDPNSSDPVQVWGVFATAAGAERAREAEMKEFGEDMEFEIAADVEVTE